MNRLLTYTLLLGLIALTSGCAKSGYMLDRQRDAADMFTAAVGKGVGIKLRAGPIHAGILVHEDYTGLRGGALTAGRGNRNLAPLVWSEEYEATAWLPFVDSTAVTSPNELITSYSVYQPAGIPSTRGKSYLARCGRFPFLTTDLRKSMHGQPARIINPYYTQIEIIVGAYGSARLGFNLGEILDFLIGWTTIDIFKDDLEAQKVNMGILPRVRREY